MAAASNLCNLVTGRVYGRDNRPPAPVTVIPADLAPAIGVLPPDQPSLKTKSYGYIKTGCDSGVFRTTRYSNWRSNKTPIFITAIVKASIYYLWPNSSRLVTNRGYSGAERCLLMQAKNIDTIAEDYRWLD